MYKRYHNHNRRTLWIYKRKSKERKILNPLRANEVIVHYLMHVSDMSVTLVCPRRKNQSHAYCSGTFTLVYLYTMLFPSKIVSQLKLARKG